MALTLQQLLDKADITQEEFGTLVGVSRVSINKLITNGNLDRILIARDIITTLTQQGKLPRGYSRSNREARAALVAKLKEKLTALAGQPANE